MTSPRQVMRTHTNAVERDYNNALRILTARQRTKRPTAASDASQTKSTGSAFNGMLGVKGTPGIKGMSEWLSILGHTQSDLRRLNVIHIAGTKGKGSTCAFTESVLRAHGRRCNFPRKIGLYTSPHLILPEERIRINFEPLAQDLFVKYFFEVYDGLPQLASDFDPSKSPVERGPRYLQLNALLAFHVFIREQVDVAIIETHSGGEFDATNVIERPIVTAVTTLGMDHIEMLGPTIENIAWHKSGIFKQGAIALSAMQESAPRGVLQKRAHEVEGAVQFIEDHPRLPRNVSQLEPDVQRQNASLALAVVENFLEQTAPANLPLSDADIARGIEHFLWPGRFQTISADRCTWYLDAAHNCMSIKIAADWFAKVTSTSRDANMPRILIYTHINELRDAVALLQTLGEALRQADVVITDVIFTTYDEAKVSEKRPGDTDFNAFQQIWKKLHPESQIWNEITIQKAISRARNLGIGGMQTLITGSQHLVGPALRVLGWDPRQSALREPQNCE